MTTTPQKISNLRIAALAAPAMPMAALTLPLIIYLPEYYAHTLGLNLALVGVIFTFVRLGDLVFDPFIGGLMDRTHTPLGHFRPWLVLGAPLVMGGTWMLFMAESGVGPIYLSTGLVLAYIGYSIVILSQMGMGTNLTRDYRERSRVFAGWQMSNTLGLILVLLLPVLFADRAANDSRFTVQTMGIFIVLSVPVTALICFALVREGPQTGPSSHPPIRAYFDLFGLDSTRRILLTQLLIGLGLGVSASVFLFFFTMIKQVPFALVGMQLAAFYVVSIIAAPLWSMLSNRIGKHRALMYGALGFAAYMLILLMMPPGNLWYFYLSAIPGGAVACANDMLPRSIMADVCDEDRLGQPTDRTGMLFAVLTVTLKFGQAMSIGIVYFALDLIGFKAGSTSNSATALYGVIALYSVIPAALYIGAAATIRGFSLTPERHAAIREELDLARASG
jgi:Na+/melibiose symporter-like transporter